MSAATASLSTLSKPLLYHLPLNLTTYPHASLIQESLVRLHLLHKHTTLRPRHSPRVPLPLPLSLPPLPPPTIITAQFSPPVYTSGLRDQQRIPPALKARLTSAPCPRTGEVAGFVEARRGGQTTWHGRGQATVYAVVDLRGEAGGGGGGGGAGGMGMGVRAWVEALEGVTIGVLSRWGVRGVRDAEYPGVWVGEGEGEEKGDGEGEREGDEAAHTVHGGAGHPSRKIATVGIHVRRFIAAHGVGINVSTDPWWWEQIVPCGIVGRGVTNLREEMERIGGGGTEAEVPGVEEVGREWVRGMAGRLGREVKVVGVEEVLGVGWRERFGEGGDLGGVGGV